MITIKKTQEGYWSVQGRYDVRPFVAAYKEDALKLATMAIRVEYASWALEGK